MISCLLFIYVCHFHHHFLLLLQWLLFKFDHYRDTHALILDPYIQGIFTKVFDTLKNSFYIKVSLVFNKNSLGRLGKQLRISYLQELLIKLMYLEKIHGGLLWTFVYHCSGNHKNVVSFLFGLFFASLF